MVGLPRHDRPQLGGDVGVVVEAEHGVGLGQRLGEVLAVALGQAADRDDGLGAATVACGGLQVGSLEQGVDGVLLGGLDEAAGVDHHRVGVLGVLDEDEATRLEPSGKLLGVDLVAGTAQGHDSDLQRNDRAGVGWHLCGGHRIVSMPVQGPQDPHRRSGEATHPRESQPGSAASACS